MESPIDIVNIHHDDDIKNYKNGLLTRNQCFRIYHWYYFNKETTENICRVYKINKEELLDVLHGTGNYKFLNKPERDEILKYRPKKIKVQDPNDNKYYKFKNNTNEYKNYLLSLDPNMDTQNPNNSMPRYVPYTDEEYEKMWKELVEDCDLYGRLYFDDYTK